ncbi:hypothetical protein DEO72_LG7g2080 [Vigna unguiculata]|uniref:Transposase n=1 Tax=Vigna unguiculata TaxID=3917 RepID=A0A4D6MKV3_VIGUN|nr:hypothetical protein DEO72_LG7g2080 [Vigna unguiculata]
MTSLVLWLGIADEHGELLSCGSGWRVLPEICKRNVAKMVPNFYGKWHLLVKMIIFIRRKKNITFNVDTSRKNYILKEAGKLLRNFRTNLANTYLKDENGNYIENPPTQPLENYASMISEDIWREFVAKHMDTRKKPKKNKERASHSKYPYRGSRKGYAHLEQEMIKKLGSNVSNIPRQELWKHARLNKPGETENENVQQVWDKCNNVVENETHVVVVDGLVVDHEEYVVEGASDVQHNVAAEGEIVSDANGNVNEVEECEFLDRAKVSRDENNVVVNFAKGDTDMN